MKSSSVVFVSKDGRVGLGLRSNRVSQPLTWAAIGGFQDDHESAVQAAYREVYEELGMRIPTRLEYLASLGPNELFLCRVPEPFNPTRLNWENLDFQWKTLLEWQDYTLHPELFQVLKGRVFLSDESKYTPNYDKPIGVGYPSPVNDYEKLSKGYLSNNPFSPYGMGNSKSNKAVYNWSDFRKNYKPPKKNSFLILNWNKMPESIIRMLLNLPKPKVTNSERHYGRDSFEK